MDFVEMMRLEPHGPDTFVGIGPSYPWGGLFGGQIVAQGLRAAALTVEPQFRVHSLHAYFIRRGEASEPIRFEVDRLRNGRSFVTRAVVARQSSGAILNMSASFQVGEEAMDRQAAVMPTVPDPDALEETAWTFFGRRIVPEVEGHATGWLQMQGPIPDDPVLHASALAFLSDELPTDSVRALLPGVTHEEWFGTSLDHAIWFHRPLRADAWHLYDLHCDGFLNARGLSTGQVFAADGTHLATITQEVLLRRRRP